jgi:hypothetical protein
MQTANTLFTAKKYDDALVKYTEALKLQPNEKEKIETEINKIKTIQGDVKTELEVKQQLKSANDLYSQKKYDLSNVASAAEVAAKVAAAPTLAAAAARRDGWSGVLVTIWIVATADIGVFTDIGDKMTRYHVPCHYIGLFV